MPQKRNPDAAELMRAAGPRVAADLQGLLAVLHGLPLAYNTDLREDKRYLFDAVDCLDALLPVVRRAADGVEFDTARMAAACDAFLMATDVADDLVGAACRSARRTTSPAHWCAAASSGLRARRAAARRPRGALAGARRRLPRPASTPPRSLAAKRATAARPRSACASSSSLRPRGVES